MRDRWTAIALAFFLGGIGVHRFYLKQWLLGIVYLLFCWTFIPTILGLLDGVVWLVRDENSFNERYNSTRAV